MKLKNNMDTREKIIDQLNQLFQNYMLKESDVMFNNNTNWLITTICGIPVCKSIIDRVKSAYPISDEIIEKNKNKEYFLFISEITINEEYYISYLLHWLEYQQKRTIQPLTPYYKRCSWLNSNIDDKLNSKEVRRLFKTDFIYPIIAYVNSQLTEESGVLHILDKYNQKVQTIGLDFEKDDKDETFLQKDLLRFLFHQGCEYAYSLNTGNGVPDFVLKCGNKNFVVEVKYVRQQSEQTQQKDKLTKQKDARFESQLKAYLTQCNTDLGCLLVFTDMDVEFHLEDKALNIKTVYIGNLKPGDRITKNFLVKQTN